MKIKKATNKDLLGILEIESMLIGNTEDHTDLIKRSIAAGECLVALIDGKVVGAAILNYTFYHQGWMGLLNVNPAYRRRGIGTALIQHMEKLCTTKKFFTSTNQSNIPAQKTYEANGFIRSGYIENLDEGDPEIIYFKLLADADRGGRL
ncbi:MAG: GNAT family N-acetyltransferase [Dehalococcoidales bacterium]